MSCRHRRHNGSATTGRGPSQHVGRAKSRWWACLKCGTKAAEQTSRHSGSIVPLLSTQHRGHLSSQTSPLCRPLAVEKRCEAVPCVNLLLDMSRIVTTQADTCHQTPKLVAYWCKQKTFVFFYILPNILRNKKSNSLLLICFMFREESKLKQTYPDSSTLILAFVQMQKETKIQKPWLLLKAEHDI